MDKAPAPQTSATNNATAILDDVLARFATTKDERLREIMLSLIRHLHAFIGETRLT